MMRALSQALRSIRRSPYQALAATIVLTLTFFIGYCLALFLLGSAKVLSYFETRPEVTGFFLQGTEDAVLEANANRLRQEPYVLNVSVISQEQALTIYREQTSSDPLLQELVTADILPPSIEVSTRSIDDLAQVAEVMQGMEGIDEVVYQQDVIDSLRNWTGNLRRIGLGVLAVFTVASLLVVILITSIRIASKKYEIRVMRLVGATKWYVMQPFLVEGMFYGVLGALIAWIVVYIGLLYSSPAIQAFFGDIQLVPVPHEITFGLLGSGVGIALLLGFVASVISTRRLFRV
jgi:cell division transport system permease protein